MKVFSMTTIVDLSPEAKSHPKRFWCKAFVSGLLSSIMMAPALIAQAAQEPSLDTRLANGLRVIVYEDRRAPTALHMVWIQAGSIDETNGKTGLAHVLEHMMFKGTQTLKPGEFSQRVAALGGRENAFTARDFTGYFQQVHRDALFEVMALEADRMQRLEFSDAEFAKEIQVVMEERRLRTDDSPTGLAYETLMSTAFQSNPVRNPIIGWMSDLTTLTAQDARDWYNTWYGPNYATLVVAGDVDAKMVVRHAESLYKDWKPKPAIDRRSQIEPPQNGRRQAQVRAPAENPFFIKAWKAPSLSSANGPIRPDDPISRDVVALSVLATLLDDPDTGILVNDLVRQRRLALSVSADVDGISRGPGLFTLQIMPAPGVSLPSLQTEALSLLHNIAQSGVSPQDLERVRRRAKASQIYQQDSLFSRAMQAGRMATIGRPLSDAFDWLRVLDSIESADLQRVVKTFFTPQSLTVIELEPLPLSTQRTRLGFGSSVLRH